ncbi:MAG: hypothetical protein JOZ43_05605 [Acidobacteriales bacterium]|nr:hypothetical protein [Terriglobales bacterium]
MVYLSAGEYGAYGLADTTSGAQVAAASALIESYCRRPGLDVEQYNERLRLTAGSMTARVSYGPLSADANGNGPVLSLKARFAQGRRGELAGGDFGLDVARAFGLPGEWTQLQPGQYEWRTDTGEVMVYPSLLGLQFNEVEVTYLAGWLQVPEAVKYACAQLVRNAQAMPALNVKQSKVERLSMEYFGATLMDDTVKALLNPYVAERLG